MANNDWQKYYWFKPVRYIITGLLSLGIGLYFWYTGDPVLSRVLVFVGIFQFLIALLSIFMQKKQKE